MKDRNGPSLPRMIRQLIVRMRKLVKNGAMTRKRRRFFQRPPLKAIA